MAPAVVEIPAVSGALCVWALLRRPGLSSWSCPFFLTISLSPFLRPHYFLLCFSFLLVLVSVSVILSVHSGEKFSEQLSFLWAVTNILEKPCRIFWRRVLSPATSSAPRKWNRNQQHCVLDIPDAT